MNILLTNDDGIESEGLVALAEAFALRGHTVTVCAPRFNQSGTSHSITLGTAYRVKQLNFSDRKGNYYAVEARPADCVLFALRYLRLVPDLLISGINDGMNIGSDLLYSGTVGAACEGAFCGVRSWAVSAFSCDRTKRYSFSPAVDFLLDRFEELFRFVQKNDCFLNVNIPVDRPIRGLKACRLVRSEYDMRIESSGDGYFRLEGLPTAFDKAEKGTDLYYVCRGYATITPLGYDGTNRSVLDAWEKNI